jgi:ketosteroid isomerase-like protein
MGAKENLEVIEELQEAARRGDWARFGELFDEDATARMAGVPADLGGVITGRDAIVEFVKTGASAQFEAKNAFGDDTYVCAISRFASNGFSGNEFLKGADKPFTTWQCQIFQLDHGRIVEMTNYVNWLDVYTQTGLVNPTTLIR